MFWFRVGFIATYGGVLLVECTDGVPTQMSSGKVLWGYVGLWCSRASGRI